MLNKFCDRWRNKQRSETKNKKHYKKITLSWINNCVIVKFPVIPISYLGYHSSTLSNNSLFILAQLQKLVEIINLNGVNFSSNKKKLNRSNKKKQECKFQFIIFFIQIILDGFWRRGERILITDIIVIIYMLIFHIL